MMTDFNSIEVIKLDLDVIFDTLDDVIQGEVWILNYPSYDLEDLANGEAAHDTYYSQLDAIEAFAADNQLIKSEQELSDRFDEDVIPTLRKAWLEYSDTPDYPMISEAFSNWTDSLVTDAELHEEQCNNYCYIGKYSDDD